MNKIGITYFSELVFNKEKREEFIEEVKKELGDEE